ncbi:LLM class flavin-dependent oxidoreductase [Pantoea sp. NPDC088449]|uniref:LLM class flavin-dependent oxidoreductase n=1 Tax=Pantoea sp. NPDC088449 TaxID=3364392 RepID=UPI003818F9AC
MGQSKKRINLGLMLQGAGSHMNAWRYENVPADASVNFEWYQFLAKEAEDSGFDFLFIADGLHITRNSIPHFLNRFEPVALLSALASVTKKIGLAGTISTSYSDPFTVARQMATLDLLSGGRAGWNVVTSPLEGSAQNFGKEHPVHSERYNIAAEYIDVVQGLWNSWEDGAFIRDKKSGIFFDHEKMHTLNHKGKYFSVSGPLNIQRSPQGQPVIFQAGASDAGLQLAANKADALFANARTFSEAQSYAKRLSNETIKNGRSSIPIFPSIAPIVGQSFADAEKKYQKLLSLITLDEALAYLGRFFDNHDFAQYDPDSLFPELGTIGENSFRSITDQIKRDSKEQQLTLREAAFRVAVPKGEFYGSAEHVAANLIKWVEEAGCSGFIITGPILNEVILDFKQLILPILAEKGYWYKDERTLLRERLDIK